MDKKQIRTVHVAYIPGRQGSVIMAPFDASVTSEIFELERKYVHLGVEIAVVGNIEIYGEYLPVWAETSTLKEFEEMIVVHFGPKKDLTLIEQIKYNVDEYIKHKKGEPNNVKEIYVDFIELVEEVSDKNTVTLETLAATEEAEKGDLQKFETVDELFDELNKPEDER